ncbi:MAG: putative Ig domain-containing protein [Chthoniobacterales bacterium]
MKFIDNGDGTATLSGRPGSGLGLVGSYSLTLTASNGVIPAAVQSFTLSITRPPRILSVNNATFVVGAPNTFTFTTQKTVPKATLSLTGALPLGVTFAASANGTATLAGTPAAGAEGVYHPIVIASNGTLPNALQTFTLTVQDAVPIVYPPAITTSATTTFTAGTDGTFTVRTTGNPTSSLSVAGTAPPWLSFLDNTDGTATLVGNPDLGGPAIYILTITATNGVSPDAVQTFTLLVNSPPPAIISVNNATFVVGTLNTFTLKASETFPLSSLSFSGMLPAGVAFVPGTNGTASLNGTPAAGSEGTYPLTITASNGTTPDAMQSFTLTVQSTLPTLEVPMITSAAASTLTVGTAGTFTFTTTGTPTPQLTLSGPRPTWLSYVDNGDGTATLSGTPDAGSDSSYTFTLTAANGVLPNEAQIFILVVTEAPAITSPASAAFAVNVPGSFNVTTTGNPLAFLTITGALPSGVSFTDNGDGTATIAGTPAPGSGGSYSLTVAATNGIGLGATQVFTLTVSGIATPTPTPTPSGTPTPTPTPTLTPTPTATPTPTPTPSGTPTPTPSPLPTRLLNISTRLLIEAGNNVAIGGFIISGSNPKQVLIRGLGPSLTEAGVPNALPDPTLELHQGHSVIASNDDWRDTPNRAEIPNGFGPGDSRESVIVMTLPPGSYTVIEAGKNNGAGVGLIEIYDLDAAGDSMLVNISTRGLVQTESEVMIGGLILGDGTAGSTIVVRAIGPSLFNAGVSNALADPTLELRDGNGELVRDNDNWRDNADQANQLTAIGLAPENNLESAIVASLPPGAYTAIVAGKVGATGVALVEVYNVP